MLVMRRCAPLSRAGARGFTLIEMLATVAVLAVVSAVAAPGMRSFALSQRAKTVSYDLVQDLLLARSEALKRNMPVTVTPVGASWGTGWTVTAGGQQIAARQADHAALIFDAAPALITFNIYGRVAAPADPVRMTVRASDISADVTKRCVGLDPSGYAQSKMGACP
jgi:type IV fimbrial biogenesis protein FimT